VGYLVATTGRLLLPSKLERQALTVAEHRMAGRQGWFDPDTEHVDSLADLAAVAGVTLTRSGDWLTVATDHEGDPKWSEQAEEFYRALSGFVQDGEVHLRGEDGSTWSYAYSPGGLEQHGSTGGDGTPDPGAAPATTPPLSDESPTSSEPPTPRPSDAAQPGSEPPPADEPGFISYPGQTSRRPAPPQPSQPSAGPPTGSESPSWGPTAADDQPPPASRGRVLAMTALLVVGVMLIIGLALLASGF
jgi:hypothetical protein